MTCGFLMPLACDLRVENGEFTWERELPDNSANTLMRSPIDFHDRQPSGRNAVSSTTDRFIIKFNNFWTVEPPPGYSLLVTHPMNRPELPFTTLTGLVDADRYRDESSIFPRAGRTRSSTAS